MVAECDDLCFHAAKVHKSFNMLQLILFFPYLCRMKLLRNIAFLIFGILAACAQHEAPPPEEDMLFRVECFYLNNPDSAMQILDTLDVSVLSKKERAHYCLVRMWVKELKDQYDSEVDSLLNGNQQGASRTANKAV